MYEGGFHLDNKEGTGFMKSSEGIYEGHFANDKRQGEGTMYYNNG